ncbi:MAG TPA: HAD hydrolase-like protein [Candidatus Nanoarchaeia archaeon]|nr:HAD hydrolase-like protein [Candidatus Nanoarchaeia archaeon]
MSKPESLEVDALDKDDVLVPYHATFLEWYNRIFGTTFATDDFEHNGLEKLLKLTVEKVQNVLRQFHDSYEFKSMTPYPGAEKMVERLAKRSNRGVVCITSRQDHLVDHTVRFNGQYFPGIKGTYFGRNKYPAGDTPRLTKAEHCKAVRATTLTEDGVSYIESCHAAGIKVVVFRQPWNRKLQGNLYTYVNNMAELEEVLMLNGRYNAKQ